MHVVALLLLTLVASGCAGAVDVAPPDDLSPTAEQACADLATALPETMSEQERRETDPGSALTAAWGDPAIILRCGVRRPAALQPTSEVTSVNGVDWFVEELTRGYLFTTYGRQAYVELTVPDDYAPEIGPVTEVSGAVSDVVPLNQDDT